MAFSPVDNRLAEEFEQLLRGDSRASDFQDQLMQALQWTEGRLITDAMIHQVQASARQTLRRFLADQPRYTALAGRTPDPDLANELVVVTDPSDVGRLTIQLPAEVRRWLMQTQSSISS